MSWRRVAILLRTLPQRTHRTLLGQLSPDDKRCVLAQLESLGDVAHDEQIQVLREMRDQLQAETLVVEKVESEIQDEILIGRARISQKKQTPITPLPKSVSESSGEPITVGPRQMSEPAQEPFQFLSQIPVKAAAQLLGEETPRTIALVLSELAPNVASDVMALLSEQQSAEVLSQLAHLGQLNRNEIEWIEYRIKKRLQSGLLSDAQITKDSFQSFASRSSSFMDSSSAGPVSIPINNAGNANGRSETEAKSSTPTQSNRSARVDRLLSDSSPDDLCRALGMVSNHEALLTLCGLPNEIAELVLGMLPKRLSRKVRTDMKKLGRLQIAEIDAAKLAVAQIIVRMHSHHDRNVA